MYKEGERYFFIHRSFQEYFTAVFFSSQMDDQLERICDFFENQKHRQYGDKTFDMLYDMIPNRIDRYVFLPLLDALWKKCDAEDGYWTFLEEMYPILYSSSGNPGDYSENNPQSFLYDFVANENLIRKNDLCDVEWPPSICLCDEVEWTSIITGTYIGKDGGTYCRSETVEMDSVDVDDDYIEEYGEPEVEGVTWEIDVHEVYHDSDTFSDLIAFIEADTFPLKDEYNKMRSYTEQLNEQINGKPESDDWFDKF